MNTGNSTRLKLLIQPIIPLCFASPGAISDYILSKMKHILNTSKGDVLYYALQKKPQGLKRPAMQQEAHKEWQTLNTGVFNGTGASFSLLLGHNLIICVCVWALDCVCVRSKELKTATPRMG